MERLTEDTQSITQEYKSPSEEFRAAISPLTMPLLSSGEPDREPQETVYEFVGSCLGTPEADAEMRRRYEEISACADEPMILPPFQIIMDDIVRPLVEAKRCYILGISVPCITQCGLVGEMVGLWRFAMLGPKFGGRDLDEDVQKLLFGRTFERLGQEHRVKVLRALQDIDEETRQSFDKLREIRREYLHFPLDKKRDRDADAREAYKHACQLVKSTLGITTTDKGEFRTPKTLVSWLFELGKRQLGWEQSSKLPNDSA